MLRIKRTVTELKRKIARSVEFPEESVNGVPDIEIKGGNDCYVSGCVRIIEYTKNRVVFEGGTVHINVAGKDLLVMNYKAGCLRVSGTISNVSVGEEII